MTDIKNNETKFQNDITISTLRGAMEHRATWFYLLLDEARKRGLEWDDFARCAINACGHFHGNSKIKDKCPQYKDMTKFIDAFISEETTKAFEAEVTELSPDSMAMEFHYCPLVSAWEKLGCTKEEIEQLCDIAMDGDRGIAEEMGFDIEISKKIADGDGYCRLKFTK